VNERIYTPTEINRLARDLLEAHYDGIWVRGEVTESTHHSSGHLYLSVRDERAVLRIVQFRGVRPISYVPQIGEQVDAYGTVTIYPEGGRYQLRARAIRPAGDGDLKQRLAALKAKLELEGLFSPERKRKLPPYPRRVGVVTSPRGAALRDIVTVAERRWPLVDLYLFPVRVQGEGAEAEISRGIEDAGRFHHEVGLDLIIVGRGGGPQEDLAAFNTEGVARAIFASPIPVVSAVGHEVDWTIADLVADLRAPTPSAAVEMALPLLAEALAWVREQMRQARGALLAPLERSEIALRRVLARRVFRTPVRALLAPLDRLDTALKRRPFRDPFALASARGDRLGQLLRRRAFRVPFAPVEVREQRLDHLVDRLALVLRPRLMATQARADQAIARLEGASPLGILTRGYSLTLRPDGRTLRRAAEVSEGERIETLLAEGRLRSRVEEVVTDEPGTEAQPA